MQSPCGDHGSAYIVAAVDERAGDKRDALDSVGDCVRADKEGAVGPVVRDQCGEHPSHDWVVMPSIRCPERVETDVLRLPLFPGGGCSLTIVGIVLRVGQPAGVGVDDPLAGSPCGCVREALPCLGKDPADATRPTPATALRTGRGLHPLPAHRVADAVPLDPALVKRALGMDATTRRRRGRRLSSANLVRSSPVPQRRGVLGKHLLAVTLV